MKTKLSYSSLKAFAKSPNHYLLYKDRKIKPTPAMQLGSIADCLVLTPEEFERQYSVLPEIDRRTKEGKAIYETFLEDAQGKELVKMETYREAKSIADAVIHHREAMELLQGQKQVELNGEIHGIEFRGFADAVNSNSVIDLKTTQDASPSAFQKQAYNLMYHLQCAIYLELSGADNFYWVAVENKAPHNVAIYAPDQDFKDRGQELLYDLCQRFKAWDGIPESYSQQIELLTLPNWAK